LNVVGPTGNFGAYSDFSKLVLMFDMLVGRLELLPMLVLFAPGMWKLPARRFDKKQKNKNA
jgi:trk system potassium uptake protein TrkH